VSASFIIDCSMTMAWCFPDEATVKSSQLLDRLEAETVLVPSLWFLEVTNVLAIAERRKRITAVKADQFLSLLDNFDIEVDDTAAGRAFHHLLLLCRSHRLTSYDAVYLDLAMRRNLALASLDDDLRREAKALGVKLLGK